MAFMERISETISLTQTNAMQAELMGKAGGDPIAWINTHAEAFRILLDREPHLREAFDQKHDECIEYIQKMLPQINEELEASKRTLH